MQVMISTIRVPDRVRKDLGNLEPLMKSLQHCGQLNPITVTRDLELIAGHRRLSAAQRLGWKMIDAIVVDGLTDERRLEMELEENLYRKDFTPDELLEGVKRLDALRHPPLGKRIGRALRGWVGKLAFWRHGASSRKAVQSATASEVMPMYRSPERTPDDDSTPIGV